MKYLSGGLRKPEFRSARIHPAEIRETDATVEVSGIEGVSRVRFKRQEGVGSWRVVSVE